MNCIRSKVEQLLDFSSLPPELVQGWPQIDYSLCVHRHEGGERAGGEEGHVDLGH